jgi:BASS family bile acid:Na+ symporter
VPAGGLFPEEAVAFLAAVTVFSIMLVVGLALDPREFRWIFRHRGLVAGSLFAVLVAVPAIALAVCRSVDLPRAVEIGIVLMAISPGAPVALRRSLGAGGHRSFAPALQVMVAALAVVSMPLWVAALEEVYAGRASVEPSYLAWQVSTAQLLPLGIGMLARRMFPAGAAALEPTLARAAGILLLALTLVVLLNVWQVVVDAGFLVVGAIAVVTVLALAAGHALGGPEPATRTAVAISSAMRNPGLALVVATRNAAPPEIVATIFAYLVVSALIVLAYVTWRRRTGIARAQPAP